MRQTQTALRTIVLVFGLLSFDRSFAFNESMTFRLAATGEVEAVISGLSDGPMCQLEFDPPSSVVVSGTNIAITSPYVPTLCFLPLPTTPYQVVASLGALTPATYQVTWTEGPLVLTGQLTTSVLGPSAIPALSRSTLMFIAILVALIGAWSLGPRSTHAGRRR